ncbi:hypothetical protein TOTORO_00990 [Serratia phage vB_SmaS-Totoro]|nr:hypothetical protein TOTORO_00990 [Serratia phage vB_SmaS-Totoro]
MANRTRAFRRYKRELKKQAVRHYGVAGYWFNGNRIVSDKVVIGKVATTPKACSCWMCANHGKVFGERFSDTRRKLKHTGEE